jgi:hypothetical protein
VSPAEDPIERYLDRLLVELRGRSRDVRRILAETEEHLRDAAAAEVAGGLGEEAAAAAAIARFGRPREFARRFPPPPFSLPATRPILAELVASILLLGAVGLIAVGASGVLAAGLGLVFGQGFVAGDPPGVTYTAARCAEYQEYEPRAPTCAAAATAHHFGEVVGNQLAAGILGLIALALHRAARRVLRRRGTYGQLLPDGFTATVGASVFGVAAALLLLQSAGSLAFSGGSGTGAMLSQGIVCLLAAGAFLPALVRTLALHVDQGTGAPETGDV